MGFTDLRDHDAPSFDPAYPSLEVADLLPRVQALFARRYRFSA